MPTLSFISRLLLSIVSVSAGLTEHLVVPNKVLSPRVTTLTSATGPQQTGTISSCNKWYSIVSGDSCGSVESAFGITHAQFITWNPSVSQDCSTNFWLGYTYCVGVTPPVQTSPNFPTMTGIPCNCNQYYDVKSGDSCGSVESKFGITHQQFIAWNPSVSQDCATNFWVDESYCVGVGSGSCSTTTTLGSTSTSSTTRASSTTTSGTSTSRPPNTEPYSIIGNETSAIQVARPTASGWPPQPTLAGTAANCIRYHYVNPGDTCDSIAGRYSNLITKEEFLQMNPSLVASNCTSLYVNYYYCVDTPFDSSTQPDATSQWLPGWTAAPLPVQNTSDIIPQPTAPGALAGCQSWYLVKQGDTCATIAVELGYLGASDIPAWNSGANCAALIVGDYYCVANYDSSNLPMPSTVATAPSPTQTGIVGNCKAWYLATNSDTCDLIPQYFGTFSKTDFLSWNPALGGTSCTGLIPGDFYCVAVPGTPTTRTQAPASTPTESNGVGPQPEQAGISSLCNAYWLVSRQDNCTTIAQVNGVTEAQIELWNPALGHGCPNLRSDYYICVGMPEGASVPTGPITTTSGPPSATSTRATSTTTSAGHSSPTPIQVRSQFSLVLMWCKTLVTNNCSPTGKHDP
ncbi:hypothetical protein B0T17DRAFT_636671 [Bombardia bombarda]|uniref:LysM domain-containing protein n=1 Tax=Bombardia bombarda TaxID=252184 RepID=A0AA39XC39_9PEZI|nr:hypothetical protein B0T17DRAFT_636671 [Bombardia bombarda]